MRRKWHPCNEKMHKVIVKLNTSFELTQKICSASQSLFVQINSKVPHMHIYNTRADREDNTRGDKINQQAHKTTPCLRYRFLLVYGSIVRGGIVPESKSLPHISFTSCKEK